MNVKATAGFRQRPWKAPKREVSVSISSSFDREESAPVSVHLSLRHEYSRAAADAYSRTKWISEIFEIDLTEEQALELGTRLIDSATGWEKEKKELRKARKA